MEYFTYPLLLGLIVFTFTIAVNQIIIPQMLEIRQSYYSIPFLSIKLENNNLILESMYGKTNMKNIFVFVTNNTIPICGTYLDGIKNKAVIDVNELGCIGKYVCVSYRDKILKCLFFPNQ